MGKDQIIQGGKPTQTAAVCQMSPLLTKKIGA
jgi:hypothetical protein